MLPCRPEVRLDIVPVDFVVDGIVALAAREDTKRGSFTLSAGAAGSISIAEIVELCVAAGNAYHAEVGLPPVSAPRIVSPDLSEEADGAEREQAKKLFELVALAMKSHLPYMITEQLFEDDDVRRRLAATGVCCPSLRDYLGTLIRYAVVHDFGRR